MGDPRVRLVVLFATIVGLVAVAAGPPTQIAGGQGVGPASAAAAVGGHAAGHRHDRARPERFEGTCALRGVLRGRPPLKATPAEAVGSVSARGSCDGVLRDRRGHRRELDGARVRYRARAQGMLSCGGGDAAGHGRLLFRGARIGFRFSEVRGPGGAGVRLEGRRGGSATGAARISADEDPQRIATACAGDGLKSARVEIDISTTPRIRG